MADFVLNKDQIAQLEQLCVTFTYELGEALEALIDRSVRVEIGALEAVSGAELRAGLDHPHAAMRFEVEAPAASEEGDDDAKSADSAKPPLFFVMHVPEARALSAMLQGAKDDQISARRKSVLDDGDQQQLGKLASAATEGLNAKVKAVAELDANASYVDLHTITTATDTTDQLDASQYVSFEFPMSIGGAPAIAVRILIAYAVAEAWNGKPLDPAFGRNVQTRGTLATYLADVETYDVVRSACRRVGLDLDNRSAAEVPNPAAYRGRLVLLDIPLRAEKRFQWCKRLKDYEESAKVILLIRQPSKQRVVSGFLAKADVIIGWPLTERELATKLEEAMADMPAYEREEPEPA